MPLDCEIRLVITTFPDEPAAGEAIREFLRDRLIACGTMQPGCRSIFVWDGKLQDSEEVTVFLKTTAAHVAALGEKLQAIHPYDVPEFLVLEVAAASKAYGDWISSFCNPVP